MSMTSQQAVERALRQILKRVGAAGENQMVQWRTTLNVVAADALEIVAKRIKESDEYEGMQTDYSVTPTAGFIDLTALSNILFDIEKSRVRVTSSNASVRAVDSYETLEYGGLDVAQPYYAQDGGGLRFRDTSGSLSGFVTPVKIRANYIPSFTDSSYPIPTQYNAAVVSTMVELALGTQTEAPELSKIGAA